MKLKTLKKLARLQKQNAGEVSEEAVKEMVKLILDNNKSGFRLNDTDIDEMTYEQMQQIATAYMEWLNDNQKN